MSHQHGQYFLRKSFFFFFFFFNEQMFYLIPVILKSINLPNKIVAMINISSGTLKVTVFIKI